MKPTVIIDHPGDISHERAVLAAIDANVIQIGSIALPETRQALREADAYIVALNPVTPELLDMMPRCKIVSRLGVGYDSINIAAATERGVWVAYVPDYGIDEVSSHAIALLMACARGIVPLVNSVRDGTWSSSIVAPIKRLSDSVVGVVGYGRIGQAAGKKAMGLGMRVLAFDPVVDAKAIAATGAQPASLEQTLSHADYVTLHVPLGAATKHLMNATTLALMKPGAYLINTARGGLIDDAALLEAIRSGRLRGAAVDVLDAEPPPPDHPLLHEPRVMITPHAAWYSVEAMRDLHTRAAEEVVRVLQGATPRCPLNKL